MARKGILTTDNIAKGTPPKPPTPRRGAVGALQSSLSKLQENAVQDIDVSLIDDAGIEDRLSHNRPAMEQLKDSLRTYGQQVPVLLRPHATKPGRYEVVYGRRRLKALRDLDMPVRALVRQLDDHQLVLAQGQENTARQDLTFIEKASFAAQLEAMNYERQTIADALSVDLPMVSRLLKVGTAFAIDFLKTIGSAPGIGRDRWMVLAKATADPAAMSRAIVVTRRPSFASLNSDARFEACLAEAEKKTAPSSSKAPPIKPRTIRKPDGTAIADIRSNTKGVTINLPTKAGQGFETWVNSNAEALLNELHDRWQQDQTEDQ